MHVEFHQVRPSSSTTRSIAPPYRSHVSPGTEQELDHDPDDRPGVEQPGNPVPCLGQDVMRCSYWRLLVGCKTSRRASTTPSEIIPRRRAAASDKSAMRPETNGPRSLTTTSTL